MHHPVLCGLSTERTGDSKNPRLHPSDANPLDFAHNDIVITPIMEARCLGVVAARRTSHNPTPCPRAGVALAVADRRRSADFVPLKLMSILPLYVIRRIAPVKSFYTGQSVGGVAANPQIAVFFFRSTMNTPGG